MSQPFSVFGRELLLHYWDSTVLPRLIAHSGKELSFAEVASLTRRIHKDDAEYYFNERKLLYYRTDWAEDETTAYNGAIAVDGEKIQMSNEDAAKARGCTYFDPRRLNYTLKDVHY